MEICVKKFYPIILVILGSFLEIYYYYFRFSVDGVNIIVSIIIAVALTVLLTLVSIYYSRKIAWFLLIPLAIYSIITTSSGQSFSLGIVRDENTAELAQELNRNDEINEFKMEIEILNIEFQNLSSQMVVTDIAEC